MTAMGRRLADGGRRVTADLVELLRTPRAAAYALAGTVVTALVIAIPTAVLPNPLFTRMTPVRPLDYAFLAASAILSGLVLATYAAGAGDRCQTRAGAGGFLAFLAIGCPICNKIVVALLGVGGAFAYFEPLQPVLGLASVVLLATALVLRLPRSSDRRKIPQTATA